MAAYITQVKQAIDRFIRNASSTSVVTATTAQGPMLINELWIAAEDVTNRWTESLGGTGTSAVASSGRSRLLQLKAPANADGAILYSKAIAPNPAAASATNNLWQRMTLEFEATLVNVASFTNTVAMIGGIHNSSVSRGDSDIAAFVLDGDDLAVVTDNGGTETLTAITGLTLTSANLYKVVLRNGAAEFWVNRTLRVTHTTNLPSGIAMIGFRVVADAGLNAELHLGSVRWYLEDA